MTNTISSAVSGRNQGPAFGGGDFDFEPATKEQAKARIALDGPSGSGKTWTALVTARALGDSTALIDTERGSASKYSGRGGFTFDTLRMNKYDPRDLVKALAVASSRGYATVIVDSLTHFWSGSDGMLEQVNNAASRGYGGNSFGGWKEATPMERQMIDALCSYPGHVIVTMRVKTEYILEDNGRGKQVPRKVGLKPEQRAGIEYEFDVVGDMDHENTLVISKSRCSELSGAVIRKPDAVFAQTILDWLEDGEEGDTVAQFHNEALADGMSIDDLRKLYTRVERRGLLGSALLDPDGNPTTLGNLIKALGTQRRTDDTGGRRAAQGIVDQGADR